MEERINIIFDRLSKSKFRSRFHLSTKDLELLDLTFEDIWK